MHWFFSLSSFVIPSKCLKSFICAASKHFSSLFLSTQASLPNFNAALAVMLWNINFVSSFFCFPKCLRIAQIKIQINQRVTTGILSSLLFHKHDYPPWTVSLSRVAPSRHPTGNRNIQFPKCCPWKNSSQQMISITTDASILTQRVHKYLEFLSKYMVLYFLKRMRGTDDIFLRCKQPGFKADQSHHLLS
jgi:hypothetical protein